MTATMNISLPETLKDHVKRRAREGNFSNPSDYVRALIRRDLEREAERKLEAQLLAGLASGDARALSEKDWHDIRREVHARLGKKKSA